MISRDKRVQKLLKSWSPEVGFKGKVIGEFGARSLEEVLEHEANLRWALKEDAPFKAIPPVKPEKWPAAPLHVLKSQLRQLIP
jgi:hypothetical protein